MVSLDRPRQQCKGSIVNRWFVVALLDGSWQVVHRLTGVPTREFAMSKTAMVGLARAATKHFPKTVLEITSEPSLRAALRKAGSAEWIARWRATQKRA